MGLVFAAALLQSDAIDEARVRHLIYELGSDSPQARDKATQELMLLGRGVLDRIDACLQSAKNPEAKKTLEGLAEFLRQTKPVSPERLRNERIDFQHPQGALSVMLKALMERSRIPIELLVDPDNEYQLGEQAFKNATLEEIFKTLAGAASLQWAVAQNRKVVFLPPRVKARGDLPLVLYDVRALTEPIPHYTLPPRDIGQDDVVHEPPEPQVPVGGGEELVAMIRENVEKATWDEEGHALTYVNGLLIVQAPQDVHGKVAEELKHIRKSFCVQLRVELWAFAHRAGAFAGALRGRIVTDAAFEEMARGETGLIAPIGRVETVAYQKQQACAFSGTERGMVTRYEEDGTAKVRIVPDGLTLSMRAILNADRSLATLEVAGGLSRIESVDKVKTNHGEVQVPVVQYVRIRVSPAIECGKRVILHQAGGLKGYGEGLTELVVIGRVGPVVDK